MSKAKFTYDESGATFFYFVLSFLALILIPATYHLWPHESQNDDSRHRCDCAGCQSKRKQFNESNRKRTSRKTVVRLFIMMGWLLFGLVAYRCATTQNEYVNWDPFEILGVREGASANDIKKAYRALSLKHHPDKGSSDPHKFVEITKAYKALTDEEARQNWEKYGNPDGPTFASYGIALPSWIVEKENSFVVLGIYALIFMVALPVSVGAWWYKSMQFGSDKVLIITSKVYFSFIEHTPNMPIKRVIMILAASLEFSKSYNPEVIEREADNQEVPRLIREVPLTGIEKNKEKPLCFSYSVKARAILYAHLGRMKLPASTLEIDRRYIVLKCPYLLQEFVNCTSQLITLAIAGRVTNMPTLFTLENAMKLGPLIVQAMWDYQSQLLQLPHFTEETLKHMERRKIKIKTIEQLARMNETDRRAALKNFTDKQYEDIKNVMGSMPTIKVSCKYEVLDDEDPNVITAHSVVTAIVNLKRIPMSEILDKNQSSDVHLNDREEPKSDSNQTSEQARESQRENESENERNSASDEKEQLIANGSDVEEDWDRKFHEKVIKRQKVFDKKPKKSHPVHCPYFPGDKQEFWWVYIMNKKNSALVTAPLLVTNLINNEEVELKFSASRVGTHSYTIVVRSDSYVNFTFMKDTKVSCFLISEI